MKIGIIAGTPVDTQMGIDYVISKGHEGLGRFCSENPSKQTEMQVLYQDELTELVVELSNQLVALGAKGIIIYCNSLSGAVNLEKIRSEVPVKLVTPLDVYDECADNYNRLSVIAANGQSLHAIERTILSKNKDCMVFGAGILPLVLLIESKISPKKIYSDFKLQSLIDSLEAMDCEALILGCTHYPYILEEIEANNSLPVINPSDRMLEMLMEQIVNINV